MPFIGNMEPQRENANGKLFREFLTDAKLVAVNTHFGCGPTYFGEKSNSRVDYVCYSSSTFARDIKKCSVWLNSGDRLQPIQTFRRKDHRPVVCIIDCSFSFPPTPKACHRFSHDLLMRGVLRRFRVALLCGEVETWARNLLASEEWQSLCATSSVQELWSHINDSVRNISLRYFSDAQSRSEHVSFIKNTIKELLSSRRDLIGKLVTLSNASRTKHVFECWRIAVKLAIADKTLARTSAEESKRRKDELAYEIWYSWHVRDLATCLDTGQEASR